jgi:spore germination protein (amino acid permease)
MDKKIVIGKWETIAILLNLICVKVVLNFPRNMAEVAGNAAWMLVVYISIITFVAFFIIQKLYSRFEGKDLIDIGEHIAGGFGRIVTGLVIIIILLFLVSIYIRIFAEDMKVVSLTTSPISYVTTFFVICMVIGAYLGIEAIARYHAIAIPIIIAGYLIIMAGVIPYVNLSNLLPIFGSGIKSIFIDGSVITSVYMELIFLFLLAPYVKTHKNFKSSGYTVLGLSTIVLTLTSLIYLAVIPMPDALERILPLFHLSRLINVGRFFQRIDSIFVLIWATTGLMYVTVCLYFIASIFQKTFRLKYYKPLILPFAALIFSLSLLPDSLIQASYMDFDITRKWGWIPTFGFTILLLVLGRFKKHKTKTAG